MMSLTIEGNDCTPAIGGGYLVLRIDNEDFYVIGVPSPNLLGDRYRDTISENSDTVEDDEGNTYNILVTSSNVGVDWTIDIDSQRSDLKQRVGIEYLANNY